MESAFEVFDWSLYGALVRNARSKAGYKTASAFSDSIYRRTRVKVSRDSLYKIEQGRQIPDTLQFMAINLSLFDELFPDKLVTPCVSREWGEIIDGNGYPLEWCFENLEAVAASTSNQNIQPIDAALLTNEPVDLFASLIPNE